MELSQVQRTQLLICLVGLLPFIVVGLLWTLGLFEFIELKTLDWRLRMLSARTQQVSSYISLIMLDTESETELGPLPWPPYLYSSLLSSLQTANPKAVGLIMRFDREWGDQDMLPGHKLFAIRLYYSPADIENRRVIPTVTDWTIIPQSLANAEGKSFSDFPFNRSDGIRRSAQLVVKDGTGEYQYSLEMLLLCQIYAIPPASIKLREGFWHGKYLEFPFPEGKLARIPLDSQGRLFIRFVGDLSSVRNGIPLWDTTSFIHALKQFEDNRAEFGRRFENKCILIGVATNAAIETPTPFGKLSALALRANLLNALINRDFIWQPGPGVALLHFVCLALVSTLAAVAIHRIGYGFRAMTLTASGLLLLHLLLVFTLLIFFNFWVEATASSLAIISAGIVNSLLLAHLHLRYAVRQLQTTQDQLVRSEREAVFGVMSAQVRHELRNALNLIRAPAEMIRNNFRQGDALNLRERPEEIVDEMDAIIGTVTTLDEMIENELNFFQDTHLNLETHDLEPILLSARDMSQLLINENHIRVNLDLPTKMPPVNIDADKMRIVFANLIKNGCQAMPQGGGLEISVRFRGGFNQSAAQQNRLTILIKDEGTGISEDELHRIFEPFHTTKPRGLGLGLVNVKNIVERHGGSVYAESAVGVSTTFCIELPFR